MNDTQTTEVSRDVMRIQSEWLFINITVSSITKNDYEVNQTMVIYTVSGTELLFGFSLSSSVWVNELNLIQQVNMKRRSALYIVNFLLPILFLLCLDLSSFMISDRGGEKLGFKITVLLAVTVMQLILNDILPSSSNRIPLIGKEAQNLQLISVTAHTLDQCAVLYLHE